MIYRAEVMGRQGCTLILFLPLSSVQIQHSQHPFLNKMRNEIQNVNISEGANSGDLSILIWLLKHDVIEPC